MAVTTYWSPNQTAIAQVETYTFSAPNSIGNTYTATINGKSVTYTSVSGDTATTAATALFNLLNVSISVAPELTEITFANPSAGVMTATAKVAGTPFANVTVGGLTGKGLVLSTGNGLSNGITTAHTTANASPSDVNDPQNWLRVNTAVTPPSNTRAIPVSTDDVVISGSSVSLLWNLDALANVLFNTYTRWQTFTGEIGLPEFSPGGYTEWRATYFKFSGPAGSAPAGGLVMVLGYGTGSGPSRERYDVGSTKVTVTALASGSPPDGDVNVRLIGYHTDNSITALNSVSVGVATRPGETSKLNVAVLNGGASIEVGAGVTWTTSVSSTTSSLTAYGGNVVLGAAPALVTGNGGANFTFTVDALTWAAINVLGGCNLNWLAGGTITALTMTTSCRLDKSSDARGLVITNSTIDGDSCQILDPLNAITFTNATTVKQTVTSGPFQFTGSRTVKLT